MAEFLTREECEKAIAQKMKEIKHIYSLYNPEGSYLSLYMRKDENGEILSFWNSYFDTDNEKPINYVE